MRWPALLAVLVLAAVEVGAQPRPPAGVDEGVIRIAHGGNELIALRTAPVAYASLDRMVPDIERPLAGRPAVRIERESARERVDYLLGVTREGTLVVGAQVHVLDPARRAWTFVRGEVVRSYPPLEGERDWIWLVAFPLSREATVTLALRARNPWPVRTITIEMPAR